MQFSVESEAERIVDSIVVASAGTMEIVAPWAEDDLFTLRYAQSGDVMYLVSSLGTYHPKRIERRAAESWSLTTYEFKDGPFRGKSADVTLTPNARTGNGTLTASAPFFDAGHVGAVFRLTHRRTSVSSVLTDGDRYTDSMRVSGNAKYDNDSDGTDEKTDERDVTFTISGTWVGTISLQVSYDDGDTYQETEQWTANVGPITRTPGYANSVAFARLGFQAGDYTSGSATIAATYTGGGGDGYLRITGVTNSTTATYEVISRLHDAAACNDWEEGTFSTYRGFPTAIGLFEGRLWFGNSDKIFGSVSDDFASFDLNTEGDSGPIIRTVATGPVNAVKWIVGAARVCFGTSGSEPVGRSSSFDEPLSPTNFSLKDVSNQGSADVQAVKVDTSAVFVQRSGKRAYELFYSIDKQDYTSSDLTRYHPTILEGSVRVMAVQRQPDTRIWFVMNDGTAAVIVYEKGRRCVVVVSLRDGRHGRGRGDPAEHDRRRCFSRGQSHHQQFDRALCGTAGL